MTDDVLKAWLQGIKDECSDKGHTLIILLLFWFVVCFGVALDKLDRILELLAAK